MIRTTKNKTQSDKKHSHPPNHINRLNQTSNLQCHKNPFVSYKKQNPSDCSVRLTFREFMNYKIIESQNIIMEDCLEEPTAQTDRVMNKLKKGTGQSIAMIRELESEIRLDCLMSLVLSDEMEKELAVIKTFESVKECELRAVAIPATNKRITVVLDIDETLIHTFDAYKEDKNAINLTIGIDNGKSHALIQFLKRPHLDFFLKSVYNLFEVIVFTASEKSYADAILDCIDPNKLITARLYRENCIARGKYMIKDLRVLGRDLSRVILVDNSLISFASQMENGYHISPFLGEQNDEQLLSVFYNVKQCKGISEGLILLADDTRQDVIIT